VSGVDAHLRRKMAAMRRMQIRNGNAKPSCDVGMMQPTAPAK